MSDKTLRIAGVTRTFPARGRTPPTLALQPSDLAVAPATPATMMTSWKTLPMTMTESFCASPTPAQRISSGMKAEAGR